MNIKTKYKIGDKVKVKYDNYKGYYEMTINGIVIYSNEICYFEEYEEDNVSENQIIGEINGIF